MEEIIKKIKYWLPKDGVPSNDVWQQTIRFLENIEKVKDRDRQISLKDPYLLFTT